MQEPFIKNCFGRGVLVTDVQCGGVRRQERGALGTGREMLVEGRQIIVSTPAMPRFLPAGPADKCKQTLFNFRFGNSSSSHLGISVAAGPRPPQGGLRWWGWALVPLHLGCAGAADSLPASVQAATLKHDCGGVLK